MNEETQYPAGEYTLYVETGFVGGRHEEVIAVPEYFGMDESEWDELDDKEKESMLYETAANFRDQSIEYGVEKS